MLLLYVRNQLVDQHVTVLASHRIILERSLPVGRGNVTLWTEAPLCALLVREWNTRPNKQTDGRRQFTRANHAVQDAADADLALVMHVLVAVLADYCSADRARTTRLAKSH